SLVCSMRRCPRTPPLFPYTTLFRSVMVVIMIVAGFQEVRLDLENAVEIERAALQDVLQRDLAALGAVQLGIRIDAADPRLDLCKDRKSTRLNSSHGSISYAVCCLKK